MKTTYGLTIILGSLFFLSTGSSHNSPRPLYSIGRSNFHKSSPDEYISFTVVQIDEENDTAGDENEITPVLFKLSGSDVHFCRNFGSLPLETTTNKLDLPLYILTRDFRI